METMSIPQKSLHGLSTSRSYHRRASQVTSVTILVICLSQQIQFSLSHFNTNHRHYQGAEQQTESTTSSIVGERQPLEQHQQNLEPNLNNQNEPNSQVNRSTIATLSSLQHSTVILPVFTNNTYPPQALHSITSSTSSEIVTTPKKQLKQEIITTNTATTPTLNQTATTTTTTTYSSSTTLNPATAAANLTPQQYYTISSGPTVATSSADSAINTTSITVTNSTISTITTTTPSTTTTTSTETISQDQQQRQAKLESQIPHCVLGEETFQIGERWNPNLPPFGIQVCVQCECTVRSRKSCFETRVACRRITAECPIIDSCPDGKRPVTLQGQCCKTCLTTNSSTAAAVAAAAATTTTTTTTTTPAPLRSSLILPTHQSLMSLLLLHPANSTHAQQILTKIVASLADRQRPDYLSMLRDLPACPGGPTSMSEILFNSPGGMSGVGPTSTSSIGASGGLALQPVPTSPSNGASSGKGGAGGGLIKTTRNDLNGIDTRLAFKSLHDSAPNYIGSRFEGKSNQEQQQQQLQGSGVSGFINTSGGKRRPQQMFTSTMGPPATTDSDHQHPNDVQLATTTLSSTLITTMGNKQFNNHNYYNNAAAGSGHITNTPTSTAPPNSYCSLGNETFQVGDVWRPILPPHGVQVCVQCNCIYRIRKGCYETKVTCRRTHRDCPQLDVCPDGRTPIQVEGQCCKSCPSSSTLSTISSSYHSSNYHQYAGLHTGPASNMHLGATSSNVMMEQQQQQHQMLNSLPPTETIQRNEKVYREFQNILKNLNVCVKTRESFDIYHTNRYAKRSQRSFYQRTSTTKAPPTGYSSSSSSSSSQAPSS